MTLMTWTTLCVLCLAVTQTRAADDVAADTSYVQKELNLYNFLLDPARYHPEIMPVINASHGSRIDLKYHLELIQMVDIDERANRVALNVWVNMFWKDFLLQWDPTDHDDLTKIHIPYNRIWTPDVEIFNDASHREVVPGSHLTVVSNDGSVLWISQRRLEIVCNFNMRHFPFDSHDCEVKVGSWTFSADQLGIDLGGDGRGMIASYLYKGHQEWELKPTGGKQNVVKYDCCPESYADVTFNFRLSRKSNYYDCIFIAPAIFLAVLVPMLFILGPGNKFSLGSGMIVTLSVFLNMLEDKIPVAHGSVPIIAQYYMGLFAFITLALVLSTITANLAERSTYRTAPPTIVRRIFLDRLSSLLCVKLADYVAVNTVSGNVAFKDDDSHGMGSDFDAQILAPRAGAAERGQWRALAATLDRLFFILTTICLVIFSFVVTSH